MGHISFFGIALINLAYAVSLTVFDIKMDNPYPPYLFIAGAVTMPLVCFLSAFRKGFRHLFFIPVLCLISGTMIFLMKGVMS